MAFAAKGIKNHPFKFRIYWHSRRRWHILNKTNLKVEYFARVNDTGVMVDVKTEVFVAPGDIIKERRPAEGADGGHVCSDGAVFHYLYIHLQMFADVCLSILTTVYFSQLASIQLANTHSTSA